MIMKMINYLLNICECFALLKQRLTFNKRTIKREWSSWLCEEWLSPELGFLGHFNTLKSLLDNHYMNWIIGIKVKDNHLFIKVLYIYYNRKIFTLHILEINTQNIKLLLPKPERKIYVEFQVDFFVQNKDVETCYKEICTCDKPLKPLINKI